MLDSFLLTISLIAVVALVWGGIDRIKSGANRHQGVLMVVAALVLVANVLIWTIPL